MKLDVAVEQLFELVNQVREASYSDDKTPLGNALALSKEVISIGTGESTFNIVVFGDLNQFKNLNDEHGHDAGDLAIGQVGELIQREFVQNSKIKGKAFRIGGDEFLILIEQKSLASFRAKTSLFKSVKFRYTEKDLETKMSFGFVVSDGKTDFAELKNRAETACISAKNEGDGTCTEWNSEVERNAHIELRKNCSSCHSINKCSVPKKLASRGLKVCSFCGDTL